MAIQIGARPESTFREPLGLLSDCHRRIERFLDQLIAVAGRGAGGELADADRDALVTALDYFKQAAPLHTSDEEQSLFPRLRRTGDARSEAALAMLEALEGDHRVADDLHAEVDRLGRRWIETGRLAAADHRNLTETLDALRTMYRRHIAVEDAELFPLAGLVLPPGALLTIGREMAERRGVDPDAPAGLSRCAERRLARRAGPEAMAEGE